MKKTKSIIASRQSFQSLALIVPKLLIISIGKYIFELTCSLLTV